MTRSEIFKAAWLNVKQNGVSLSAALKAAWAASKAPKTPLAIAQARIAGGSKFNGVVYQKNNGKHYCMLFIYLDGEVFKLESTLQSTAAAEKKAFEAALANKPVATSKNEWIVNDKKIVNRLDYGQMYERYGMDFE